MANQQTRINPVKTTSNVSDNTSSITSNEGTSSLIQMQLEMKGFFELLMVDNQNFDTEKAFKYLMKYIKNHKRILYSTVSHIVYDLTNEDASGKHNANQDRFGSLLSNIEKLVAYADTDSNISTHVNAVRGNDEKEAVYDTQKAVWKIWDHVNLAHRQYDELRQSDSEYDEKFTNRIEKVQSKITSELNAQLLTMVGIFTALAFVLFGGISSLENVLSGLKEEHLLKLLIIGCGWGIGMINVVFVFLFCIGKMTKLSFKSSMSPNATLWQRYPVVIWTNYILLSLFLFLSWIYYSINRSQDLWLEKLISSNPVLVSILGMVLILILIIFGFYYLNNKTKPCVGDEDN